MITELGTRAEIDYRRQRFLDEAATDRLARTVGGGNRRPTRLAVLGRLVSRYGWIAWSGKEPRTEPTSRSSSAG